MGVLALFALLMRLGRSNRPLRMVSGVVLAAMLIFAGASCLMRADARARAIGITGQAPAGMDLKTLRSTIRREIFSGSIVLLIGVGVAATPFFLAGRARGRASQES